MIWSIKLCEWSAKSYGYVEALTFYIFFTLKVQEPYLADAISCLGSYFKIFDEKYEHIGDPNQVIGRCPTDCNSGTQSIMSFSFLGPVGFCVWLIWGPYWAWVILGFRGCCVWAGFGYWAGGRTLIVTHSGVPLCVALVGLLPLVVVGAGGQTGALGAGGPCVYLWWWEPWLVCLWILVGTGVSWWGWRLYFLGLTGPPRVLLNFLFLSFFFLFFLVPYSVFLYNVL